MAGKIGGKGEKKSLLKYAVAMMLASTGANAQTVNLQPGQRVFSTGERLDYDAGTLFVPEHHARPQQGSRIAIPFERYRARHPSGAAPIFFLAGGPGSSALDRLGEELRRKELLFYSEFADIVYFDQRSAGRSLPVMPCADTVQLPLDRPSSAAERIAAMRGIATACRGYWKGRRVDLSAYTTPESVEDVVGLAKALGYRKISLIGGSYGSHLGFSLMRLHPEIIDRAMLRGIEGPDDTYDVPSQTLGAISRIAAAAEAAPELAGLIPPGGLIAALRTVEARLDAKPVTVTVDGKTITLGGDDVRLEIKTGANRSGGWPAFVINMYNGDYSELAKRALRDRTIILNGPEYYMMDCASGLSPERKHAILSDPAKELLGDINEDYFATCDIWDAPDLGSEFRSPVHSSIPMLVFEGTWDTSTPQENAIHDTATFTNLIFAHVEGGTHSVTDDLYQSWAPMRETVRKFLEGGKPDLPSTIVLPRVIFEKPKPAN